MTELKKKTKTKNKNNPEVIYEFIFLVKEQILSLKKLILKSVALAVKDTLYLHSIYVYKIGTMGHIICALGQDQNNIQ